MCTEHQRSEVAYNFASNFAYNLAARKKARTTRRSLAMRNGAFRERPFVAVNLY